VPVVYLFLLLLSTPIWGMTRKPAAVPSPVPAPSYLPGVGTQIQWGPFVGFTASELPKIKAATELVTHTLNSECYHQAVLKAAMTEKRGLSNEAIWDLVHSAKASLRISIYTNSFSKVVGRTSLYGKTIEINRKFFSGATPRNSASNLSHELMHVLGFTHQESWPTSVPYTANRLFEECAP
jgi:hypothetical protein